MLVASQPIHPIQDGLAGRIHSTTIEQLIEAVDSYYICWYGEKRIQMSRDSLNLVGQRAKLGLTA